MQLSELKRVLGEALQGAAIEVQTHTKNQTFGYADKGERVSFVGIEYAIEMHGRPEITNTIAPAMIWDTFASGSHMPEDAARYIERKEMCLTLHKAIRSAGYILVSAVNHAHAEGTMVRCEYYKSGGDGWTGTALTAVYSPTDYMPDGAIIITDDQGRPDKMVYYTVGYEEGQLTYMGACEFDGRPNRSIAVNLLEGAVWKGVPMTQLSWNKELLGIDVKRVYSKTLSESPEGWRRTYLAELYSEDKVQIVVTNYHWSSDQGL